MAPPDFWLATPVFCLISRSSSLDWPIQQITFGQQYFTFVLAPYFFPWPCSAPPHFFHSRIATVARFAQWLIRPWLQRLHFHVTVLNQFSLQFLIWFCYSCRKPTILVREGLIKILGKNLLFNSFSNFCVYLLLNTKNEFLEKQGMYPGC